MSASLARSTGSCGASRIALRSSISAALRFPFATYCSASLTEAVESLAYAVGHANIATADAKTTDRHGQRLRPWGIGFPFLQTTVTRRARSGVAASNRKALAG